MNLYNSVSSLEQGYSKIDCLLEDSEVSVLDDEINNKV